MEASSIFSPGNKSKGKIYSNIDPSRDFSGTLSDINVLWAIYIHFWRSIPVGLYESCCCCSARCRQRKIVRDTGETTASVLRQMEEITGQKITRRRGERRDEKLEMRMILAERMGNTHSFLLLSPQAAQLPQGNHKVCCQTGDKAVFMQQFPQPISFYGSFKGFQMRMSWKKSWAIGVNQANVESVVVQVCRCSAAVVKKRDYYHI